LVTRDRPASSVGALTATTLPTCSVGWIGRTSRRYGGASHRRWLRRRSFRRRDNQDAVVGDARLVDRIRDGVGQALASNARRPRAPKCGARTRHRPPWRATSTEHPRPRHARTPGRSEADREGAPQDTPDISPPAGLQTPKRRPPIHVAAIPRSTLHILDEHESGAH
jgi:hypothetical protein